MISLQYKGRIHKGKFSARSIRYILSDQAARLFPALQRRWVFPVEGRPMAEVAREAFPLPSDVIEAALPGCHTALGISWPEPIQQIRQVYSVDGVVVTGWAGAMIKDGLLLTLRAKHNWVSSLRGHPHRMRTLSASRPYFNLMAPIPARGHIFHWLYDSIIPLIAFLESGAAGPDMGLIVNAKLSGIQARTIGFIKERYGITAIEPLAQSEALLVPRLHAVVADYSRPGGLESPLGLARLADLGRFVAGDAALEETPKRIYVSRNDARLRRVLNEDALLPELKARGFERVTLAGMPVARQVVLFLNAEAVAGAHGAGLAHISWCKPGTKITEFFPTPEGASRRVKNATANFWFISVQRKLDYSCHFAGPVETRSDGFTIPRETLVQALES
jgi:Glycosyltransferase 61